jgi:hypothetical protein
VPHLVRAQDQQEQRRVGEPVRQARDVQEVAQGQVEVEQSFPRPAAGDRRGQESCEEETGVEPDLGTVADPRDRRSAWEFAHERRHSSRFRPHRVPRRRHAMHSPADGTRETRRGCKAGSRYECCC